MKLDRNDRNLIKYSYPVQRLTKGKHLAWIVFCLEILIKLFVLKLMCRRTYLTYLPVNNYQMHEWERNLTLFVLPEW